MIRLIVSLIPILLIDVGREVPQDQRVAARASLEAQAPASLDQLSWMVGFWEGDDNGTHMEELWLPRRGDVMLGLHVDLTPSGRTFFEYLRIEQKGTSLIFLASPRGGPPTSFIATSVTDSTVTFENSQHDYPQKIGYRLDRDGRLRARISGEVEGAEEATEWVWTRSDLPADG